MGLGIEKDNEGVARFYDLLQGAAFPLLFWAYCTRVDTDCNAFESIIIIMMQDLARKIRHHPGGEIVYTVVAFILQKPQRATFSRAGAAAVGVVPLGRARPGQARAPARGEGWAGIAARGCDSLAV